MGRLRWGYRASLAAFSASNHQVPVLTPYLSSLWLALVTMDAGQGPSVNLRAPIVVNPARMLGFQDMPHNSLYPLRHPLALAE